MALSKDEALDTVIGQLADAFFWLSEGDELEGDERESVAMGSVDLAAIFSEGTKIEIVSVKDDEITMTMRIVDVLDYLNKTIQV